MKIKLLLIGSIFCVSGLNAQMSGTYTVNAGQAASATNYANVASAVSDLMSGVRSDGGPVNGPGVAAPVTVRLAAGSGPYTEQITIGAITGASLLNSVRITGGPTMEEINFANTTTTDRQVIKLNACSYVQLDSLTLVNTGATYGVGVHITNASDYNAVTNCDITVSNTSTSANYYGIAISGSTATTVGDHGDYNLIQGNSIHGGYYGISINGTSSTVRAQQNYILNNIIDDYYYYGIRNYMQQNSQIIGNYLSSRTTGSTSGYGIYNYYSDAYSIEQNNIARFGAYGIYTAYNNTLSGQGLIANNFIGGENLATTPYGIYCTTSTQNVNIYHNSVSLTSGNGRCIYILSGSGNNVVNNSLSIINSTTGYALYVSNLTYVTTIDYNNFYAPGSSNFVYLAAAYTPATFVGGGGFNTNSINANPGYYDPMSDLHIGLFNNLWDMGTNVGVTNDFDGDLRPMLPTIAYDIGADEHTPDSVNIISLELLDLTEGLCPDSNHYAGLVFMCAGYNVASNIPFTMDVSGASSFNQTVIAPGPFVPGEVDTVWFGPINTYPGGPLSVIAYADYANDQNRENDTLFIDFNVEILPTTPVAINNTVCQGTDVYAQVVNDGLGHIWYDGNGNIISTSDSLFFPSLPNDTTVWVANANLSGASMITTYANNNSCGGGNMFRVTALSGSIYIDSFYVNASGGTTTVSVYSMSGDYVGNETNAAAWTWLEDVSITSAGAGTQTPCILTNPITIPAGQTVSLYLYNTLTVYTTAAGDFSNSDILVEDGTGLCSQFGGTNYPRTWNGTIHYRKFSCPSPAVPLTITAAIQPVVDLGPNVVACGDVTIDGTTAGATDYVWSTGGSSASELVAAPYSGPVILTASNMYCAPSSDTINVTAIQLPDVDLGGDTYFCAGGSVVLDGTSSAAGATYEWNTLATTPTIVVTSVGTYSVTVTDPATTCTNADTVYVSQENAPTANFNGMQTVGSTWQFNDLSSGSPTSWSWDFGDGTGTSTAQNPSYTYTAAGSYTVTLTVSNACGSTTFTMNVEILGLDELHPGTLTVYPNPSQGIVYGKFSVQGTGTVNVMDMNGRVVQRTEISSQGVPVMLADLGSLENGNYVITVTMDQQVFKARVVKQ